MEDWEETEWIKRAQQGDNAAFDKLVRKHRNRIVNWCNGWLGSFADSEEMAQVVFSRAWLKLSLFRFEYPFSTWLLTMATNLCLNRLRKKRRRNELLEADLDDGLPETATDALEEEIMEEASYALFLPLVRELAKNARPAWDILDWRIFRLYFLYSEENLRCLRRIALELNRSENTIKDRFYNRIKPLLKEAYTQWRNE